MGSPANVNSPENIERRSIRTSSKERQVERNPRNTYHLRLVVWNSYGILERCRPGINWNYSNTECDSYGTSIGGLVQWNSSQRFRCKWIYQHNRILLIIWCIDLTILSRFSAELESSTFSQLEDFDSKWQTVETDLVTQKPAMVTRPTTKSPRATQNIYKNKYGFNVSESYESQTQRNDSSSSVPDTQLLYHSLKNPLFKSDSLNIETHGDIHKISNPFQSNWIFSPSSDESVEKLTKSPKWGILFKRESAQNASIISPSTNSSLNYFDNFTSNSHNFSKDLDSNSSFLQNFPSFKKLEEFDNIATNFRSTPASTAKPTNTQKSFFGYEIKEVTSNGKTHGTVQVFGSDVAKENTELTKPTANITTPKLIRIPETVTKKTLEITTTTPRTNVPTTSTVNPKLIKPKMSTTTYAPENPRHIIIKDVQPLSRASTFDQPIASDFATPEFILYDFLDHLQSYPHIPTSNFGLNNRYSSFDELVSENIYTYKRR